MMRRGGTGAGVWWFVFLIQLLPFVFIVFRVFTNTLGAEPAKALVEFLGEVAATWLLFSLSLTPLARFKWLGQLRKYRRMIGLYVFFYACLHVVSYGVFLVDWRNFVEDLYSRQYVVAGAAAFVLLACLAVTSPKAVVRKLGKKWKRLHRLVYVAGAAAILHVWWQSRSDYFEALVFLVIYCCLMMYRYRYFRGLLHKLLVK